MIYRWQDEPPHAWNADLLAEIVSRRNLNEQSKLGVSTGPAFSGPKNLYAPDLEALFRFRLYVVSDSEDWALAAWANITEPGGAVGEHNHANPGNVWSGCYYLTGGAPIVFPALTETIHPSPGLMLVWPAEELHLVRPQAGGVRVSVAMNARPKYGP